MKRKPTAQSAPARRSLSTRRSALLAVLLCAASCSIITGTLVAFFSPDASVKVSQRTLTFTERVAYQRAIEEVYWRHRIWPKERADPKPSLDTVMSQAKLEKKVADYLRKSQALEDCWQKPITAEQLQAEMNRMAKRTKKPEVLRELFDALGHDPFVVAECLARPALSDRLTAEFSVQDKTGCLKSTRINAIADVSIATMLSNAPYNLPTVSQGVRPCIDDRWTQMSAPGAPLPRYWHTAVWTGSEMIVWGGFFLITTLNDGGKYDPATDSWTTTSTTNAPSERCLHTAVWTGSEMIVWGGGSAPLGGYLNTGGRYDPTTDSWIATTISNAPTARYFHTAVWTGSQMIIWGGYNTAQLNTGGRYDPNTDSWTGISTTNAPSARQEHTAIWTESEMIVWGGYLFDGSSHFLSTGGRYDPTTNSWTSTNPSNAPNGRRDHTAVWTGDEMLVWGGQDENLTLLNTGGRYNPSTDNWLATSTNDAPTPRQFHTALWTDNEMIVWSGYDGLSYLKSTDTDMTQSGPSGSPTPTPTASDFPPPTPSEPPGSPTPTPPGTPTPPIPGTGGKYDPTTDSWTATSTANAASERELHTAVWTGSEMIVWGGADLNGFLNTGGRYCTESAPILTPTPTPTPTSAPCSVSTTGCGGIVTTPPTNFSLNVSEPVDPATLGASDFTVNGTPADNVFLANGDTTVNFTFNASPAVEGLNTMHIAAGAFNCSLGEPVAEFTCTFLYATQRLSPTPRPRPTARPRP